MPQIFLKMGKSLLVGHFHPSEVIVKTLRRLHLFGQRTLEFVALEAVLLANGLESHSGLVSYERRAGSVRTARC